MPTWGRAECAEENSVTVKIKDINASKDMYAKRLAFLKVKTCATVRAAEDGKIGQCQAASIIQDIEDEVNEIIKCGEVLEALRRKG